MDQKVNLILQALNMREESEGAVPGMRISTPTITGAERKALVAELVKVLTAEE